MEKRCNRGILADLIETDISFPQVNVPKTRRTYCKGKDCRKHTQHKVTQYKAGKVQYSIEISNTLELTCWIRLRCSLKESVVMTESNLVMVVRQNPFSTRRQRPQRRLC